MDDSLISRSLILLFLLLCSAFFSACEVAYFSLNSLQLNEMSENKGRMGRIVNSLLEKPRELLITIYIGNEFVNIAISVVITSIAISIFGSIGVGIAIGGGTLLLLVFGDIIPKSISIKYAQPYALFAAYPLKAFAQLVQPAQKLFTVWTEKIIGSMGILPHGIKESPITDEEFRAMVQVGEGEGVIDSDERELIQNVIEFGETTVGEIMTPKIDMFTVNIENSLDEILPRIIENFYSRVPVYGNEEEDIVGILFTKDLTRLKHLPREKVNLKSILHPTISVPKSKKIKEMLEEFRKSKRHMAIVLDEYGSVCGLVTLEDVLEELVGEIDSEMRQEELPLKKLSDKNYRIAGAYSLAEFNESFQSELPEDDYDTVGGYVFGLFGRIPRSGESTTVDRFKFRVEKMKGSRILSLFLTLMTPPVEEETNKEINEMLED
ncbi:MAG: HlyC/CorC family transporter [Nitrospinae bacterium]|nr:HlyC/CorC family transporter [Nitrospinota bacterium]MZH46279.1 HlyC/CorC family transporter [Nitrospinota bacterium]